MAGNLVTTAIITNGLSGGLAVKGLITTYFSLYVTEQPPPPPPVETGGGGGPYPPRGAWNQVSNIQQFYKPVEQSYLVPRDREVDFFKRNLVITFKVKIANTTIEKTFAVPERGRGITVKVFGIMEATKRKLNIAVSKIKRIATKMKVAVSNIRNRKDFP
jgi:hypothetical protein